jgi:type II secretory ATPase GspE/PulE/Tfp pilus assembly ATPase PilB-like protein/CheY-like chemotaxis protein
VAKSLQKKHWLVHVLRRAGIVGAEDLGIDPGAPPAEAWSEACEATGISLDELAAQVADYFRLQVANLDAAEAPAVKLVPEKIARQYGIFPLREDDRQLTVATADPTNFAAEQALGFVSGRKAVFQVAPPPFILDSVNANYSADGVMESLLDRVDQAIADSVAVVANEDPGAAVTEAEAEAAPVIKLTNLILRDATKNGASDIHIEPGSNGGTVRFRVDGVLRNYMQLPIPALIRVVSRIKIMGNLDIADKWRPQDGRTRIVVEGRPYDVRISTVPTRDAEKVVLRILKGGEASRLSEIGLPEWELGRLRQLLANRDGIVCVTGPTGSGKTTTLYAGIRELATGEVNIMTVEDPVEYELPGITQIQVQTKRGVTFASALRAILRQDPDVILVGEIRDLETAEVAVQAAMTGHLVLATLHTNDAVSAVARLLDIGLDRPSIAATLRGTLAQRLVRKVCDECGEPIRGEMTEEEIRLAKLYNIRPPIRSVGCRRCAQTGYRGRLPIQEVFLINNSIADLISGGATYSRLYQAATSSGMRALQQVGIERVRSGETTLDELERVLGLEAEDPGGERRALSSGAEGAPARRGQEPTQAAPPEHDEPDADALETADVSQTPARPPEPEPEQAAESATSAQAPTSPAPEQPAVSRPQGFVGTEPPSGPREAPRTSATEGEGPAEPPPETVEASESGEPPPTERPDATGSEAGRRGPAADAVEESASAAAGGPSQAAPEESLPEAVEESPREAREEPRPEAGDELRPGAGEEVRPEAGEEVRPEAGERPALEAAEEPAQEPAPAGREDDVVDALLPLEPLEGMTIDDLEDVRVTSEELIAAAAAELEKGPVADVEPESFDTAIVLDEAPVHPTVAPDDAPILIVDDDPEDRLLVRTILTKHGFEVDEVRDGGEALEHIGAGDRHSLVVLDLEMPNLDGREVLARLRSDAPTSNLPVVVLTSSPNPEDEYKLMEAGADDYLRKPLDPPRFIARIKAALRRARMM